MAVIEVLSLAGLPDAADPRWREWLTAAELASCGCLQRTEEHLVARLAGKLALAGEFGEAPPWHEISIERRQGQPPTLLLPPGWRAGVSLSHAGGYAAALAWDLPTSGT